MFTPATYAVHAPALSLPEAAMLPALPKEPESAIPRNLILPDRRTYHPMPAPGGGHPVDNIRRGSVAGRAVLRAAGIRLPGALPKEKGRA